MTRRGWRGLAVLALPTMVAGAAAAQMPGEYLDVFIAKSGRTNGQNLTRLAKRWRTPTAGIRVTPG
jgi:hypothetical protein